LCLDYRLFGPTPPLKRIITCVTKGTTTQSRRSEMAATLARTPAEVEAARPAEAYRVHHMSGLVEKTLPADEVILTAAEVEIRHEGIAVAAYPRSDVYYVSRGKASLPPSD